MKPMESTPTLDWISVSPSELSVRDLRAGAPRENCGAVVTFRGAVRSASRAHDDVEALACETSTELAEPAILAVIEAARTRWPAPDAVAIHHRIARVELRETAVVVAVAAPHRQNAFEAAQYRIDALKESVPMWRRNLCQGGSTWSADTQTILKVQKR